jgi:MFS family permease
VTRSGASRPPFPRTWLIWTAGFLAFPVAGLAGGAVAGRVDSPVAALLGGAVTGLVIGAGQALVSSRRLDPRRWIPATTIGMSLGLLLGATTVGYRTSLADLALMGALTGVALGVAQTLALPRHAHRRWAWAAALPFLWALGWTATTLAGIAVDVQFTVFGAIGAVTFSALSGLLLHRLLPHRADAHPADAHPAEAHPAEADQDRAHTPGGTTP